MQLWPIAHFFYFVINFRWVQQKQQQIHPKVMTEWKKWAIGQSCICKEVTSYKIHTLGVRNVSSSVFFMFIAHYTRTEKS